MKAAQRMQRKERARVFGGLGAEERAEVVEEVFAGMAEGKLLAETVRRVAGERRLELTPGQVRNWLVRDEEWFGRYQRMKTLLGQALAEEAIEVARESTNQSTAIDRVLIETLKWAAAKSNPAEYGDRQVVEHQGAQRLEVKVVEESVPMRQTKEERRDGAKRMAVEGAVMRQISAGTESAVESIPVIGKTAYGVSLG